METKKYYTTQDEQSTESRNALLASGMGWVLGPALSWTTMIQYSIEKNIKTNILLLSAQATADFWVCKILITKSEYKRSVYFWGKIPGKFCGLSSPSNWTGETFNPAVVKSSESECSMNSVSKKCRQLFIERSGGEVPVNWLNTIDLLFNFNCHQLSTLSSQRSILDTKY